MNLSATSIGSRDQPHPVPTACGRVMASDANRRRTASRWLQIIRFSELPLRAAPAAPVLWRNLRPSNSPPRRERNYSIAPPSWATRASRGQVRERGVVCCHAGGQDHGNLCNRRAMKKLSVSGRRSQSPQRWSSSCQTSRSIVARLRSSGPVPCHRVRRVGSGIWITERGPGT